MIATASEGPLRGPLSLTDLLDNQSLDHEFLDRALAADLHTLVRILSQVKLFMRVSKAQFVISFPTRMPASFGLIRQQAVVGLAATPANP